MKQLQHQLVLRATAQVPPVLGGAAGSAPLAALDDAGVVGHTRHPYVPRSPQQVIRVLEENVSLQVKVDVMRQQIEALESELHQQTRSRNREKEAAGWMRVEAARERERAGARERALATQAEDEIRTLRRHIASLQVPEVPGLEAVGKRCEADINTGLWQLASFVEELNMHADEQGRAGLRGGARGEGANAEVVEDRGELESTGREAVCVCVCVYVCVCACVVCV